MSAKSACLRPYRSRYCAKPAWRARTFRSPSVLLIYGSGCYFVYE